MPSALTTKLDSGSAPKRPLNTLASTVYDRLRSDILTGKLAPSRKLAIDFLCKQYETGQIPIREALNRLTSDGLVNRRDRRGFHVAPVNAEDLADMVKTRCILESAALRESIAARTPAWEERIVLAYHRMSRAPRSLSNKVYRENPEWEKLHREFHLSLISACGSRWLLAFCAQLADQTYRYCQIGFQRTFPVRNDTEEHRQLMEAVIDGNADKATRLFQKHLRFTAEIILKTGIAQEQTPDSGKPNMPQAHAMTRKATRRK